MPETRAQRLRRQALDMHAYADRVLVGCDHGNRCACGECTGPGCWRCSRIAETYRGFALDFLTRAIKAEAEVTR